MSKSRLPQFTHMTRIAPLALGAVARYAGCVCCEAFFRSGSSEEKTSSNRE